MLPGAAVPGPPCCIGLFVVVHCRARPMRPLATPWTVLHDCWLYGCAGAEMRVLVCATLDGSAVVGSADVAIVHSNKQRGVERRGVARADIGSSMDPGHDLRRSRCLTHMF